ncbi:MAG: type II toxin-antitoxin system VapC family toxin [Cytophagales bacterium]|nr:MAG: type II toxin-antitoxin system VapC family toxin [Cytophagales bacterium]
MTYLLDTHTLIWATTDPEKLSPAVRQILEDSVHTVLVSSISFWEIALKHSIQRITLNGLMPEDFVEAAKKTGFELINLDSATACTYHKLLPLYHRDPFDRMLIWQALRAGYRLISKDENIHRYASEGLQLVW